MHCIEHFTLEALTELGFFFRSKRMIRSLEKTKDRLGLLHQKKQRNVHIREASSGKKVQYWDCTPGKQPNWRTERSTEKQMGMHGRSRSKLLLNQKTDFIYTFQPMEGFQSCLFFLASLLTLLWKLFSGTLFPIHQMVPPIQHHHWYCHTSGFFLNIQRPSTAFPLLCSTASCLSQDLGRGQGLMTHPLPHCLGGPWELTF